MKPEPLRIFWFTEGRLNHAPTRHRALIYESSLVTLLGDRIHLHRPYEYGKIRADCREVVISLTHSPIVARIVSSLYAEVGRIRFILKYFLSMIHLAASFTHVIYLRCFPSLFQRFMFTLTRKKIYFDFDDPLYLKRPAREQGSCEPEGVEEPVMARKMAAFLKRCTAAIVSNDYLAAWARQYARTVHIIPTSVEIPERLLCSYAITTTFIIGWIGAPENQKYLMTIFPGIRRILDEFPACRLHIITSTPWDFGHPAVVFIPWHIDTWQREVQRFSVGLAPLDDSPWTRGKMQFKAVQCAAQGVPVVGSTVGFDLERWKHDKNILFAHTPDEYYSCLKTLITNQSTREAIGKNGLALVREHYAAEVNARRIADILSGSTA
ncbi:MAG: hypothetical protein A2487_02445 [Candidatus Raymondbacteria bacterium RifOxyC12_full_50_8]|uniref:Glycosyl transferase family 1 domain-containing protein n=1 Tax=Candidatus Raymondbacteria bacterium RIFOXYD12_FULL_49_13 TaxID=1817890 RepID=A0A1F7FIH4_UNCRA|nr:MAG: hypothetical protein A2248_20990 [Candidatus Raymondbacteria bacterium RIFOXYA2_FULL_49_16]OGJ99537.1 MAG: hypothetical protein A2350_05555 [Candidatus Raymondbacteria bacterium RifOxyB12_full_50_8]OGK06266.1 MAG: hypothetical protein A2519_08305 [Candidatus Raymondbacteria bacterium RIFOXYD12_FULL_49_13]OGK07722.1 MAG: hypothetical protein A2487_02445 [Candidatus Raymondbacteria bacterium RifOxyC12_full_50_8]OGP40598.1 MAG: hypothetical protein A2324_03060 [Candidatus Raymondbacteria b